MIGDLNGKGLKNVRRSCLKIILAGALLIPAAGTPSKAAPVTADSPLDFFTNVASRFLSAQLNLNLNQIEVYPTNQYTPAVQRLLQVTANLYDATTTNYFPTVFRPVFSVDAVSGDAFISGYQQVTNVTGPGDLQLSAPVDPATLAAMSGPVVNLPVNVYGIPWIISAKKGFPGFNKLSLETILQIWRKLEVVSSTPGGKTFNNSAVFTATNMMWVFGISTSIGVDCWNPYINAYVTPNNFTISAVDNLSMSLIATGGVSSYTLVSSNSMVPPATFNYSAPFTWPGSTWLPPAGGSDALNPIAQSPFFIPLYYTNITFLPSSFYNFPTIQMIPQSIAGSPIGWQGPTINGVPLATPLPQMVLLTTNHLQLVMLDGSNVIDYVQFSGPNNARNLNPVYENNTNTIFGYPNWWSTNLVHNSIFKGVPAGIASQIYVSETSYGGNQAYWGNNQTALTIAQDQIDGFAMFMGFFPPYQNNQNSPIAQAYQTNYAVQVPYTPGVTIVDYTSWEANDPLVHYTTNDLSFQDNGTRSGIQSGIVTVPQNNQVNTYPQIPDIGNLSQRFAPWGVSGQVALGIDTSQYNLAYKDPLIWGSDDWTFPIGQPLNMSWFGQVHRGTPWQTMFLKATNVLQMYNPGINAVAPYIGLPTWQHVTGDTDPIDAAAMAPVQDWQLASLFASLINTNDFRLLFSVNNTNPNAWQSLFDGLTAYTNDGNGGFVPVTISSNSVQASILASAMVTTLANQPGQFFGDVGTILSVPQLTTASPWLDPNTTASDEAYEEIPSEILPLLRMDAIGSAVSTNGQRLVQFTGYDGHNYAVETSSNLVDWISVSTNSPADGLMTFPVAPTPGLHQQFYRSVLLN